MGNDPQYALRRLRTQRPDLHARVLAGDLSPHGAMVEAGFRRRTVTVALDVQSFARAILRHFDTAEIDELVDLLRESPED